MKTVSTASIIIPNFNGVALLKKNLRAVYEAYKVDKNIKEILVVDDASTDSSVKFISQNYPEIKIVKHKINRGFSYAVNTGARSAKGKLLVLLNNDVSPNKDFLNNSIKFFDDNDVFAVSFNEGKYLWANGFFEKGFIVFKPGRTKTKVVDTFWANGGSAVFRRKYWMELGGLDEKLFSPFYWEDIDLSYRAQKHGWRVLWDPLSKVVHEHESTTGTFPLKYRHRIQERNQLLFIWKNLGSPILIKRHIVGLFQRLVRHPGYLIILMLALAKLPLVLPQRLKQKKDCKVSDEAIFQKFM
jgi:GT2 family glycosyltransferase